VSVSLCSRLSLLTHIPFSLVVDHPPHSVEVIAECGLVLQGKKRWKRETIATAPAKGDHLTYFDLIQKHVIDSIKPNVLSI